MNKQQLIYGYINEQTKHLYIYFTKGMQYVISNHIDKDTPTTHPYKLESIWTVCMYQRVNHSKHTTHTGISITVV